MIVAVPAATPVTLPVESTVATVVSEEFHVTVLSVAFSGETVASRVIVFPASTSFTVDVIFTSVTATVSSPLSSSLEQPIKFVIASSAANAATILNIFFIFSPPKKNILLIVIITPFYLKMGGVFVQY